MPSIERRAKHLLQLFADNKASAEEIKEMLSLLRRKEGDQVLESFIRQLKHEPESSPSDVTLDWDDLWSRIHQTTDEQPAPVFKMKWLYRAAAVILVLGAGALYFFNSSKETLTQPEVVQKTTSDEIMPGGNKAILTLANGSQIVLDDATAGKVAEQGNAEIIKDANGQLVYKRTKDAPHEILYNTVSTPRGGQYKLVLPDGSNVWLNAISSIRYPTDFAGNERVVEITGEAYFEITYDATRQFRVMINTPNSNRKMEVAVLGTGFNINAYPDEPATITTLVHGSVKVIHGASSSTIKPGQQTNLNDEGKISVVNNAKVEEAIAWKEGRFEFKDAGLKTILRQVMRWYDVDVEYQGTAPDRYFTATMSRQKTLSGLLNILEQSDVQIELKGNKLIVKP